MFLQILQHTPVWVWGIFAALLYLGYFQSRPHTMARRRVAILPSIFIGLSIFGIWSVFGAAPAAVAGWGAGFAVALSLNRRLRLPRVVHYDAADARFSLPGSFGPLALMMAIFATRYVVTVVLIMSPATAGSVPFALAVSLVYGLLSGAFFARSLRILGAAHAPKSAGLCVADPAAA